MEVVGGGVVGMKGVVDISVVDISVVDVSVVDISGVGNVVVEVDGLIVLVVVAFSEFEAMTSKAFPVQIHTHSMARILFTAIFSA